MIPAIVDRYIATRTTAAIGVVLACFVALTALFALVEELGEEEPGYGLREAGLYVLYTLPRRVSELAPYVAFLGALIGLGILAGASEVTALRAAGVSLQRLFAGVGIAVASFAALAFTLGEWAAPRLDAAAEALRSRALQASETVFIGGYWHRQGERFTHIQGLSPDGSLIGVTWFEVDGEDRLRGAHRAQRGERDEANEGWLLRDVAATEFHNDRAVASRKDEVPWVGAADLRSLTARALLEPRRLSLADLSLQIGYMDRERLDARRYRLAWWGKALEPFTTLGLALLAVGFVVGPLRETSMGTRIAAGTVVGLLFKYLQDLLAPASLVFNVPPWLAISIPIALCLAAGIVLLRRAA